MNNSLILTIKNAKFSWYCFYINLNILGDFQIYIQTFKQSQIFKQSQNHQTFKQSRVLQTCNFAKNDLISGIFQNNYNLFRLNIF